MKKLPIIIMLSAAGITGVAMAQTSSSTEVGKDMGSYGKTSGAYGSKVSNGAAGTTGMNGASSPSGYGYNGAAGMPSTTTTTTTTRGGRAVTPPAGGVNGGTSSTEIGEDLGSYGKTSGATGSKVSPSYGRRGSGAQTTNGAAGSTMQNGAGMSGVTWTCPSGYTLSTATRDGTPLCYPNTGPMPGGAR